MRKVILIIIFCLLSFFPPESHAASLWSDATTPTTASFADSLAYELGVRFQSSTDGYITALRFYKGSLNTGLHYGTLWTNAGIKLADVVFTGESASGWQQATLDKPVKIAANTVYVASYYTGVGRYALNTNYFTSGYTNAPLSASSSNGLFITAQHRFPSSVSGNASNYWIDIVFETSVTPPSTSGSGPLLLITSTDNNFTNYLAEILRAEGLNEFATIDISNVSANVLANYDLAVLGEVSLSSSQATVLSDWVTSGGNLIAMRPDSDLLSLLGLTSDSATLSDGYIKVATASAPGKGIVGETIQYHGTADKYTLNGATAVATLYSDASTATTNPAVSIKSVGSNGGQAAAFTYDLAKSVIYTRQGNPSYEGVDRNGDGVIRSNDLFHPDYLNLDKVHIPQADEQQRLLANMILSMNLDKKPLPRFWYLPNKKKAALLYAVDDHATAEGTKTAFNTLLSNSAAGCTVEDWECLRGTSWLYPSSGLTNAEATSFYSQGFEFGVHTQGCTGCTPYTYNTTLTTDLASFQTKYTGVPTQTTHRFHAIPWTDWISHAKVGKQHNIRFDMNYYYFPATWTGARPGFMTGSGFPQKFAAIDGSVVDVYQQNTEFTNDNQLVNNAQSVAAVLDRALGSEGYYGILGTHDDRRDTATLSAYLSALSGRDVPMVSAHQVLTWLDGRNDSTFSSVSWDNTNKKLSFSVTADSDARNLYAMLPTESNDGSLLSISKSSSSVSYTTETVKGISYAFFAAETGSYEAAYSGAATPTPTPTTTSSSSTSSSSTSSSPSTKPAGWKYDIMAGPNFVGVSQFISGVSGAQDAKVFIAQNTHHDDLAITITKMDLDQLATILPRNPFPWIQRLNTVSEIYNFNIVSAFNGYPISVLDNPAMVIIPYDQKKLRGISPQQLRIAWYNPATQRWEILRGNTVVDSVNRTVANTTRYFSYFAVVYNAGWFISSAGNAIQTQPVTPTTIKPTVQPTPKQQQAAQMPQKTCLLFICW